MTAERRARSIAGFMLVIAIGGMTYVLLRNEAVYYSSLSKTIHALPSTFTGTIQEGPQYGKRPLVNAARKQIGVTTSYDPSYQALRYPMGDVPKSTGVCADVVVRAFRDNQLGPLDLQQAIHEDMQQNFQHYPKKWGLTQVDANIDHRRVPNLTAFFERRGWALKVSGNPLDYQAGDVVAWSLGAGLTHIGIVSDRHIDATPLIIHNIGQGAREEDILFKFTIIGHYRPLSHASSRRPSRKPDE